jgi:hypothetical protein
MRIDFWKACSASRFARSLCIIGALSYVSPMIADIRRFLAARPFEAFAILTSGGDRYPVPSGEHAAVVPQRSRVVVWLDDGSSVTIAGLYITALEKAATQHV